MSHQDGGTGEQQSQPEGPVTSIADNQPSTSRDSNAELRQPTGESTDATGNARTHPAPETELKASVAETERKASIAETGRKASIAETEREKAIAAGAEAEVEAGTRGNVPDWSNTSGDQYMDHALTGEAPQLASFESLQRITSAQAAVVDAGDDPVKITNAEPAEPDQQAKDSKTTANDRGQPQGGDAAEDVSEEPAPANGSLQLMELSGSNGPYFRTSHRIVAWEVLLLGRDGRHRDRAQHAKCG
jgi:hypothetical protein